MVTTPIRIALLGAGPRAVSQVEAMKRSGVAVPVGVWNRTSAVARDLEASLGLEPIERGVSQLIHDVKPDVVSIVTHPVARYDLLREAIEAGAPAILLEKPIALTPAELDLVAQAGEDCFIAVNTQYPWMQHWQNFRRLIADGVLGELRTIRASTGVDILEQGPHLLSLALSAARSGGLPAPTWVLAGCADEASFGELSVPANTTAVIDLGEARLQLLAGAVSPNVPGEDVIFYQQQVEITGSKGRLWVSLNQGWQLWTSAGLETGSTAWPRDDYQSQAALFRDLAAAVRSPELQASFPTRMQTAALEAELLFACIESGEQGRRVTLSARSSFADA